jgi:hypothetical protein
MGCSVLWKSQLQTSIATSTMESEYTALSMALRAAIPLLEICIPINHGLGLINRIPVMAPISAPIRGGTFFSGAYFPQKWADLPPF